LEKTKAHTHLIESSNSSLRDNVARFNRRSKRHSKSWEMLEMTLELFINKHIFEQIFKGSRSALLSHH
jgi:IS1 family transposase